MEAMFLPGVENNPKPGPYHDSLRRMRGTGLEYPQIWHLFAFLPPGTCESSMPNRALAGCFGSHG